MTREITRTNGQRRAVEILGSVLLHLALLLLLFVVLLPLLWMLVTAFKQRGQGMNLSVIPSRTAVIEAEPTPIPPRRPGARFAPVTFELDDPEHQNSSVTVAGTFNDWDKTRDPLTWSHGVWARTLIDQIPAGACEYKFVLDGNDWISDPANPPPTEGGNSVLTVDDAPMGNRPLADATRIEGGRLIIDYRAPDLRGLVAQVRPPEGGWVSVPLTREGDRWQGETDLRGWEIPSDARTLARRYTCRRPFAAAWRAMYTLGNFRLILTDPNYPFGRFFLNSLVVASGCGAVTVILCLLAGYAFAVKRFPGREAIFWGLLATMLIPGLVFVLPQFAVVNALRWRNTYQGMILPHVANVFGVFLIRQYIQTMPGDLFAAARIDGAGEFQVLRRVVVPLSLPIIVTLFLLTFMMQWSNFLWQLVVNSPDSPLRTLPVGLALFRGQHNVDWELMMAGACFSVVPIAILFLFAQRFFIQGLTAGAVKG